MKKGRHRRFEEARKLKQSGPDFLFSEPTRTDHNCLRLPTFFNCKEGWC